MKRTRICLSVITVNEGIVLHRENREITIEKKPIAEYNKRHNEFMSKDFNNQSGSRIVMNSGLVAFDDGLSAQIAAFKKLRRA